MTEVKAAAATAWGNWYSPATQTDRPMTTIAAFLTDDHRACDDSLVAAERLIASRRWDEARASCDAFRVSVERHFAREEEVLFPAFEAATGMTSGPTAVMRSEHGQIRQALGSLQAALGRRDRNECLGIVETLVMLIQQHNAKEENVLYPMSDRALGAGAAALVTDMQGK
jgi:hypothetical protein